MRLLQETLSHPRFRPATTRLLVLEAIGALFVAWLEIRFIPFSRLVATGRPRGSTSRSVDVKRLARAVEIGRKKVPWRAKCFESGLALRMMLRRRRVPSVLHYGMATADNGTLSAHVWLSVNGQVVIGGDSAMGYTEVGQFPSEA